MPDVIDRRTLLGGLAVAAALPGCTRSSATGAAAPAPAAGTAGATGTGTGAGAPAASSASAPAASAAAPGARAGSLAPLPPLADAVFAKRAYRLRALAREAGASVVLVTSGTTSLAYLVGSRVERSERLIALVLPVDGEAFFVAPAFELERLRRQTRVREMRPWEEHESPYSVARDALGAAHA